MGLGKYLDKAMSQANKLLVGIERTEEALLAVRQNFDRLERAVEASTKTIAAMEKRVAGLEAQAARAEKLETQLDRVREELAEVRGTVRSTLETAAYQACRDGGINVAMKRSKLLQTVDSSEEAGEGVEAR